MSLNETKYTKLVPLFGRPNDNRVKLFLNILETSFLENRYELPATFGAATGGVIDRHLQEQYYQGGAAGVTTLSPEWNIFACDLLARASDKPIDADVLRNILNNNDLMNDLFVKKLLIEMIPQYKSGGKSGVFNTLNNLNPVKLADLTGFLGPITLGVCGSESSNRSFTYDINRYLPSLLEDIVKATLNATTTGKLSKFWDEEPMFDSNENFTRVDGVIGKMENGAFVPYNEGSAKYDESKSQRCAGTLFKDGVAADEKCSDYISKCLDSGNPSDISACKDFMKSANFWQDTKDEVKNMNPNIMVTTLEKFGFNKKTININSKNLIVFEDFNSWVEKIKNKGITDVTEIAAIKGNEQLKFYLDAIVKRINSNPAILNKQLFKSADATDYNTIIQLRAYAGPIGIPVRKYGNSSVDIASLRREIDFYKNDIAELKDSVESRYAVKNNLLYILNSPYYPRGPMRGGAMVMPIIAPTLSSSSIKPRKHAELLEIYKDNLLKKLQAMGKSLSGLDIQKLNASIEQYKKLEFNLMKSILYVEKYIDIASIASDEKVDIDVDHMIAFVNNRNKYFSKTINSQTGILEAFELMLKQAIEKVEEK